MHASQPATAICYAGAFWGHWSVHLPATAAIARTSKTFTPRDLVLSGCSISCADAQSCRGTVKHHGPGGAFFRPAEDISLMR